MKWINFTERWPDKEAYFYFSPGVNDGKVLICTLHPSFITGDDAHWMEIEIDFPLPPERKNHFCRDEADNFACYESYPPDKRLWIRAFEKGKMRMDFPVKYCPFCSFTLEK